MTLVVSWIGKDSHGYTSAYIASDSRVSWSGTDKYDDPYKKPYFSKRFPDIVGYCEDVLFPTLVLQSIFELKKFYFNVYFRKFIGNIAYRSAVLGYPNSHVQHLLAPVYSRKTGKSQEYVPRPFQQSIFMLNF